MTDNATIVLDTLKRDWDSYLNVVEMLDEIEKGWDKAVVPRAWRRLDVIQKVKVIHEFTAWILEQEAQADDAD